MNKTFIILGIIPFLLTVMHINFPDGPGYMYIPEYLADSFERDISFAKLTDIYFDEDIKEKGFRQYTPEYTFSHYRDSINYTRGSSVLVISPDRVDAQEKSVTWKPRTFQRIALWPALGFQYRLIVGIILYALLFFAWAEYQRRRRRRGHLPGQAVILVQVWTQLIFIYDSNFPCYRSYANTAAPIAKIIMDNRDKMDEYIAEHEQGIHPPPEFLLSFAEENKRKICIPEDILFYPRFPQERHMWVQGVWVSKPPLETTYARVNIDAYTFLYYSPTLRRMQLENTIKRQRPYPIMTCKSLGDGLWLGQYRSHIVAAVMMFWSLLALLALVTFYTIYWIVCMLRPQRLFVTK